MGDTDKHERIDAGLHPEVVRWCSNMAQAARHHKCLPEVIADFDRLLAFARGEGVTASRAASAACGTERSTNGKDEGQR